MRSPTCCLLLVFTLALGCSGGGGVGRKDTARNTSGPGDPLEMARQMLAGSPDRTSSNLGLQQLNVYLSQNPDKKPAPLSDEERRLLQTRFGLDDGELKEVDNTAFTLLDAAYLDSCYLLRDAVRSLGLEQLSPAERAAAAFAWVVRQVMVEQPKGDLTPHGPTAPPEFILRRGLGTAHDRAHVYLAVLQQLGIPGCLITSPGAAEPWSCGALVELGPAKEKQILLFDHRLGLPLPGGQGAPDAELAQAFRLALPVAGAADGQEIATLAGVRKQPQTLAVLNTDDKHRYDVSAEQVGGAQVQLAVPLSALAPRMRLLQNDLLPPGAGLRLAVSPSELLQQFGAAPGVEGGADAVRVQREAAGLLRRFLPEAEGGIDKEQPPRRERFNFALVPFAVLPRELRELGGAGERLLARFADLFIKFQMEPGMPRDLLLRGRLKEASHALTEVLEQVRIAKNRRAATPEVEADFARWKEEITQAHVALAKAQEEAKKGRGQEAVEAARGRIEELWTVGSRTVLTLADGAAADPRGARATYTQVLCMFEQALRAQQKADQAARSESPTAAEMKGAARRAWKESASWSETYTVEYPQSPFTPAVQLLQARSHEALGDVERARRILEDAGGEPGTWRAVACRYLAGRLKRK